MYIIIYIYIYIYNYIHNKTSTRYKAIIHFWRLSIANQDKNTIDKNTCEL